EGKRQRLRESATPRAAERIARAAKSEFAEKPLREAGKAGETIRQQRGRRAARAGNVERNHLALRQRRHERFDQFQAGADPVEDDERRQMRRSRANADAQPLALYGETSNIHRETQRAWPAAGSLLPSSAGAHVGPGRIGTAGIAVVPQPRRRRSNLARALRQPSTPMLPPRSGDGLCLREPVIGARNERGIDEVFALWGADRIDQRPDMATRAEHEFVAAAERARHPVAVAPGGYVIGEAGDDEFVARDLRHVDRNAEHLEL